MSATAADFIAASGFVLRDDVAIDASIINITNPKQDIVPTPPTTIIGSRIKITSGTDKDYYRITDAAIGRIVAGGMDWANVRVVPKTVRAYTAGASVSFEPYVVTKAAFPTFTVKQHQHLAVALLNYFSMVGGKDSDLTFTAHPGGAQAQFTVHGTTLRIDGRTRGAVSCTVSARDRAQGVVTQTLAVVVAHENRRPTSIKALGDPTIVTGGTLILNLNDYFSDPDGDVLAFTVSGQNANVTATLAGAGAIWIKALSQDTVDLLIDATDPDGLDVSQQMTVTATQNRRPDRIYHVDPVAVAIGGATVRRAISDYFSDPDGRATGLSWLAQWEEGDPAKQYRQEFWHVTSKTGTNLLAMESLFEYPTDAAPWGTGAPWKVPAGTDFVWRNGSPVVRTTDTLLSEAIATWDATAQRVKLSIRSATALAPIVGAPSRVLLGIDADVAWIEGDQRNILNFLPGDVPGSRTAYVKVWDQGGLFASDLFPVALGHRPVGTTDRTLTLFTGEDKQQPLGQVFTDADGDKLTYSVIAYGGEVAKPVIHGDMLLVHGLAHGASEIELRAVDPIGLAATGLVTAVVQASAVAKLPPLISLPFYTDRLTALIQNEGAPGIASLAGDTDPPFPDNAFRISGHDYQFPLRSADSQRDNVRDNKVRIAAFFGSGDPPEYPRGTIFSLPRTSTVIGWAVTPSFKAPQQNRTFPFGQVTTVDTTTDPYWSLMPVPIVGDRFYFEGFGDVAIATIVSVDGMQTGSASSFNTSKYIRIDLTLDVDETAWAAAGFRWFHSADDKIIWLPRPSGETRAIGVMPRDRLPRDFSSLTEYLESEVVIIDAGSELDLASVGVTITIGNDNYIITSAHRRYYRGTPLFWEVLLQIQ